MSKLILTELKSWEQIFQLDKYFLSPFIFRGHSDHKWDLTTSIERTISKFNLHSYSPDYSTDERWMLHEFKRKSHQYSNHNIDFNDHFEWLAIMQHFGAPTRLLDFTYSVFIAAYFAVIESTTKAAIWAANKHIIRDNLVDKFSLNYQKREVLKDEVNNIHIEYANTFINRDFVKGYVYPSVVIPLEPKLLNERLSRQQGLFLMPTNPKLSFTNNLLGVLGLTELDIVPITFDELIKLSKEQQLKTEVEVIKIEIPSELHREIIRYLSEMNITSEILFPGLTGLAQSLVQTQVRN